MFREGFAGCSFFILEHLYGFCLTEISLAVWTGSCWAFASFDRLLPGSSGSGRDTVLLETLYGNQLLLGPVIS